MVDIVRIHNGMDWPDTQPLGWVNRSISFVFLFHEIVFLVVAHARATNKVNKHSMYVCDGLAYANETTTN